MDKEALKQLGLSEEQITSILDLHTQTLDGKFIPKHRFDEVNTEVKSLKTQLTERDTQIADLKKFEGTAEELKKQVENLQTENQTKTAEYEQELAMERKKNAVKLALLEDAEGRPHDADMVLGLFNLDEIEVDAETGKITSGYDDQNKRIREEKVFLFTTDPQPAPTPGGVGWKPKGNPPADGDNGGGKGDTSTSYGKSLAKQRLAMAGITESQDSQ